MIFFRVAGQLAGARLGQLGLGRGAVADRLGRSLGEHVGRRGLGGRWPLAGPLQGSQNRGLPSVVQGPACPADIGSRDGAADHLDLSVPAAARTVRPVIVQL